MLKYPSSSSPSPVRSSSGPGQTGLPRKRTTAFRSAVAVCYLLAFLAIPVYSMYGAFTQSGLPAYIMQLELWITGWSETKVTVLLTIFVLFMLFSGILRIYGRLATSLGWVGGTDPNWVGPGRRDGETAGCLEYTVIKRPLASNHGGLRQNTTVCGDTTI
jgi:hypothetical protein